MTTHFPFNKSIMDHITRSKEINASSMAHESLTDGLELLQAAAKSTASLKPLQDPEESDTDFRARLDRFNDISNSYIDAYDAIFRETLDIINQHDGLLEAFEQALKSEKVEQQHTSYKEVNEGNYHKYFVKDFSNQVAKNYKKSLKKFEKLPQKKKYGNNQTYIQFREMIWDAQDVHGEDVLNINKLFTDYNSDDEDFVEEQIRESFKCPLTKQFFELPVTSKICHHSFSCNAIMEVIKSKNGRTKCPIPACAHEIRRRDLFADPELEERTKLARDRELRETQAENATLDRL
jgi:hypothetical protein